jgi:hypothetical protein
MHKALTLTLILLPAAGCSPTPTIQTGADAEVSFDGLNRVDGTIMDAVWVLKGADLTAYRKIRLEGIGVEFRPVTGPYSGRAGTTNSITRGSSAGPFPLDEATQEVFIAEIAAAFTEELGQSDTFEIVDESGPDVLLVRAGLLDVVSMVPPDTVGRSDIFIQRVGEATLVLELRDSESKAIFLRAVDRRAAQRGGNQMTRSTSVTNRAEVRRLGQHWAGLVREGLDTILTTGPIR